MANADLIGCSPKFQAVVDQINVVAPVDCSVLVQGETGTGKEVVAREIHDASPRRHHPFVTVNCAAIPSALLESELFGHKRGAFTGAVTQTIGRFQAADGGTLFLDEIGDLPLELQPKLLRVLQEQQFEPLGSVQSVHVDVRVIAATNQDLWRMVQERKFRADLYYRLNVFPIALPPLRERGEDIPVLVEHFVRKFATRQGKSIDGIPGEVMEVLKHHHWPGNIRELQNFVERAVIMTTGSALCPPIEELMTQPVAPEKGQTLTDAERAHITATLRNTNWVVGGRNGAAARLGLPRTTLVGMMKRLGISRETVQWTHGTHFSQAATVNGLYTPSSHGIQPVNNQAVLRSGHETRLYQDICEALTEPGGYLLAWVGFAEDDPRKSVRIAARSGPCREYLNALEITWGEGPLGEGPVGTCIRSGEIAIVNDVDKDPRFEPWRRRAAHYRCRSSVALPLRCQGRVIGILSMYAAESDAFDPEEMSLLLELANEILNMVAQDIDTRECTELVPRRLAAIRERGKARFESLQLIKGVTRVPLELNVCAIDYKQMPAVQGVARDSERRGFEPENRARMAEMERAKAEAESANRSNSQFVANINHEIHMPLNGIIGMAKLLLDSPLEPGQREVAEMIRHRAEKLLTMLNEIDRNPAHRAGLRTLIRA